MPKTTYTKQADMQTAAASSSSNTIPKEASPYIVDEKTGEHKVHFIDNKTGKEFIVTNRNANEAYAAVAVLTEKLAQAKSWVAANQGMLGDIQKPPIVDKEELYKNEKIPFFECPIFFELMDGKHNETTPYVYSDGNSYTVSTYTESPLTRERVLPAVINQPLIDAEKTYYQLMLKLAHLKHINPTVPSDFSPTDRPAVHDAMPPPNLDEKIASLYSNVGIVSDQDKLEAKYFIRHYALLFLISQNTKARLLPRDKEIVTKHVEATLFTLTRAKQANELMSMLEKALRSNDIIAEVAQQIESISEETITIYRKLKIQERACHTITMSQQYQDLITARRKLENKHPLLREWSDIKQVINAYATSHDASIAASSSSSSSSDEKVTVYFRIGLGDSNSYYRYNHILYLPHLSPQQTVKNFVANFDFQKLAQVVTCDSLQGPYPIGLSEGEAINIENLHSHYYYRLLVGVQIDESALSRKRMNEKERCPNQLNVHSQSRYHYLEEPIACEAKDIVSVRLMNWRSYFNSFRIRGSHSTDIWPQKLEHIKGPHLPENQAGKAKASAPIAGSSTGSFSFDFSKKFNILYLKRTTQKKTLSRKSKPRSVYNSTRSANSRDLFAGSISNYGDVALF